MTGAMPKVSIITVTFNSAATVVDTMRSVASQRHEHIEHIVIDGASSDATLDLVRLHGHRVSRIVCEPDRGIYDAMNKGLALASGDLVGFLNADDVLANDGVITDIVTEAQRAPAADAVFGDLVYVRSDDLDSVVRYWRSGAFHRRSLALGWMPPHPTLYVRRTVLREIGSFDANLRVAADYEFILRLLTRPKIRVRYLPQVLVRMRTGGASNHSLEALWLKSREDLLAIDRHRVGGWHTLVCKNLRKIPQWLRKPAHV
jgi:glycosyltransferase